MIRCVIINYNIYSTHDIGNTLIIEPLKIIIYVKCLPFSLDK